MTKSEIITLVDSLLPRLYGYAYALMGSELHAEQLIIDAYTVYIISDKDFLTSTKYDFENKFERTEIKKYLLKEMYFALYELAMKRAPQVIGRSKEYLEYSKFYELDIQKRAIIYLKEVAGYPVEDLQEIFSLKRFQVLEVLHNARNILLSDSAKYQVSI